MAPSRRMERHLGPAVGEEVVDVPELVVAGAEPLLVGLHAHQRADVLRAIDVPGRGVAVLLARQAGRHRIEVGALPERRRQLREAERDVEALGALDDGLGRRPLEQRVEAGGLDHPRPALRPAVADPVRGDQLGRRPLVARRQLVLRPAVQAVVERLRRRQRVVEQLHHLVDGHAVVGDLEREVRLVAQLARDLVAQLDQLDQAGLERAADLLRHRPDALALGEIARLLQRRRRCRWR